MVNNLDLHVNELKITYIDFQSFLDKSLETINNKSELIQYIDFVRSKNNYFNNYINNLNIENSSHLYGLVGGVCRFFSEFNWFDDSEFYDEAEFFKNKLSDESQFIHNYFHK